MSLPFSTTGLFIVLIFLAAFLLSLALTTPVFGSDASSLKKTRERIKGLTSKMEPETSSLLLKRDQQNLSALGAWLHELPQIQDLARLLRQLDNRTPAHVFAIGCVVLALVMFLALTIVGAPILAALPLGIGAGFLPVMKLTHARKQRLEKFEGQLPEAMSMMARAMRAGLPFADALKTTGTEMPDPMGAELRSVFSDINYGLGVKDGLLNLLTRVPSVSLQTMVTAVLVQRETGGNLAEILEKIAAVVRGRHKLRRRIKSLSAEGRMSAWVLVMIPLGLAAVISISSPTYLPLLLNDPLGQKLLWGALAGLIIAVYWMRQIINIRV